MSEAAEVKDEEIVETETEIENTDSTEAEDTSSADDQNTTEEIDFLSMPDDEVDNYFAQQMGHENPDTPAAEEKETETADDDSAAAGDDDDSDDDSDSESDPADSGEEKLDKELTSKKTEKSDDKETSDKAVEKAADKDSSGDDDGDEVVIQALSDLERILSPFKANGKDIQVETVDDALTLMQMGANYNKKMAELKPNLKFVKMLEQNDLLNEDALTTLIDIHKKNPAAIAKFIKDSDIDPDSVTADDADESYTPGKYKVNESEIELDQVLDSIRDNESFPRTIDIVSNQWDPKSKGIIFNDPKIIAVIDSQIQSGVFDRISTRMETEKMLGKLNGISDIEAYRQIGVALEAAGQLYPSQESAGESETETVTTQAEKKVDKALNSKRKAAATTKRAVASKKTDLSDINPLAMSDSDFEKLAAKGIYI